MHFLPLLALASLAVATPTPKSCKTAVKGKSFQQFGFLILENTDYELVFTELFLPLLYNITCAETCLMSPYSRSCSAATFFLEGTELTLGSSTAPLKRTRPLKKSKI